MSHWTENCDAGGPEHIEPCQHIWNAHSQCQWCHRDRKDIDYEDGLRDVRDLLLLVSPNITPMESLSGLVSQLNNYTAGLKADRDERAVQKGQFFAAMETLRDEKDAIKNEVCVVLMMLDELAELWGDEGKFRTCRDRLRKLLPVPR